MYRSTRLEYLFAIEVQKAQVYKIDLLRYSTGTENEYHKARTVERCTKVQIAQGLKVEVPRKVGTG